MFGKSHPLDESPKRTYKNLYQTPENGTSHVEVRSMFYGATIQRLDAPLPQPKAKQHHGGRAAPLEFGELAFWSLLK